MIARRRQLILSTALAAVRASASATVEGTRVDVWKGPACGWCKDWHKHLEASGFQVAAHDTGNGEARARLGMPVRYGACDTAEVAGYAIGHGPAREIRRLPKGRPVAIGPSVPAMPRGSPGMDGHEVGMQREPHNVLLVLRDRSTRTYQSYG